MGRSSCTPAPQKYSLAKTHGAGTKPVRRTTTALAASFLTIGEVAAGNGPHPRSTIHNMVLQFELEVVFPMSAQQYIQDRFTHQFRRFLAKVPHGHP